MNSDENLNNKLTKIEQELESLKQQLKENKAGDDKRHQEIKEIRASQHKENQLWNKTSAVGTVVGAITTPLAMLLPLWSWFKSHKSDMEAVKQKVLNNQETIKDLLKRTKK